MYFDLFFNFFLPHHPFTCSFSYNRNKLGDVMGWGEKKNKVGNKRGFLANKEPPKKENEKEKREIERERERKTNNERKPKKKTKTNKE